MLKDVKSTCFSGRYIGSYLDALTQEGAMGAQAAFKVLA